MFIFITLGIVAAIFQLVILREFSFSIAKNELALVVTTGLWIVFCALGSIIKIPKKFFKLSIPSLACLSFAAFICLIHLVKSLSGLEYYQTISLNQILFLSIILIGPTAFIIGLAFRHLVQDYLENHPPQKNTYAKFFAFEALGFFFGGLAFTFYFIRYTNPLIFSILPLILLPGLKNRFQKITSAALIIAIGIISIASFDTILKQEFSHAKIIAQLGSAYGPLIATQRSGATTLFFGGSILATSEDQSATEEFVHTSLAALSPLVKKDILFIGAALSGQIEEIAKYKPNSLDCLQPNPLLIKLARARLPTELKNAVNFIAADPRIFLQQTGRQYDAILMSMPAPINLSLNRYFTENFFKLVAQRLKPGGIFSFFIPSKREILSPQFIKFNSSILNALDQAFCARLIIPANSMMIIASNREKIESSELLDNFALAKPKTQFFTFYHLKDYLDPSLRSYAENMLDKKIPANTDLNPTGFLNYLILEQAKFYPNLKIDLKKIPLLTFISFLLLGLVILISRRFLPKISCLFNIGAIGFTSISLSSIIFVLFQLFCASLFWKLGLLIGLFMAGVSCGIFLLNSDRAQRRNLLFFLYLSWMATIFILFFNLRTIGASDDAEFIFYFAALLNGIFTGSAYPILTYNLLQNKFRKQELPITIYFADLIGAFLGTLICGIILIPFLGIPSSLLLLIFLNAIFALKNLH